MRKKLGIERRETLDPPVDITIIGIFHPFFLRNKAVLFFTDIMVFNNHKAKTPKNLNGYLFMEETLTQ